MERGRFERWNRSTVRGTQVHTYAAQLAAGEQLEVADELTGYVDAYLRFVDEWQISEVAVEAMVVNRRWRYAGTLDLLATSCGAEAVWLLDWKTGASGIWPETALQLAAYAHADLLNMNGEERPMPPVERAAAVWLRADGYDVVPVDISENTFRAFLYAQQVAAFHALPPRGDGRRHAAAARARGGDVVTTSVVHSQTLVAVTCTCGIAYTIPETLHEQMLLHRGNGTRPATAIYCPLGHEWHYTGQTAAEKERAQRKAVEAQLVAVSDQLEAERRAHKRTAKRVANGVCPCCHRSFTNVRRHMNTQHPDYTAAAK